MTHGAFTYRLTEGSLRAHIGKGREGNRKGREVGHPSIVSTGGGRIGFMDGSLRDQSAGV